MKKALWTLNVTATRTGKARERGRSELGISGVDNTTELLQRKLQIFIPSPAQPSVMPVLCWRFTSTHSVTSHALVRHPKTSAEFHALGLEHETCFSRTAPGLDASFVQTRGC